MAREYRFKNRSFQAQQNEILTVRNLSANLLGRAIANRLNPPFRQDFCVPKTGVEIYT